MKRLIVLLATLLLSFGLISAADQIDIQTYEGGTLLIAPGDTLFDNTDFQFSILIGNESTVWGLGNGYVVTGDPEVPFEWRTMADGIPPDPLHPELGVKLLTLVDGGRMLPGTQTWDIGGFIVNEQNVDNVLPDTVLYGGAALGAGLQAGPLDRMLNFNFHIGALAPEAPAYTLCIDSTYVPPGAPFVFVTSTGTTYLPECLWGDAPRCYPVKHRTNACPEFSAATNPGITVNHCGQESLQLSATDFEGDAIAWGISDNTGAGAATVSQTGNVTYTPTAADVGNSVVITVFITDANHSVDGCNFQDVNVTVTNNAPSIVCPADFKVGKGNVATAVVTGSDVDACDGITFGLESISPAPENAPTIDANGEFSWLTAEADKDKDFTITAFVFDGTDTTYCDFMVSVLSVEPYGVMIEKTHGTYQGTFETVAISMTKGSEAMGGFDFLLAYDNSLLTFTEASLSPYLQSCGWEYFTYRYGSHGNCGTGCPSGEIRLTGLAEENNGAHHPNAGCIQAVAGEDIALLTFFVTSDVNANGQFAKVSFYWFDCADNSISVMSGDTLALADNVYYYYGEDGIDTWEPYTEAGVFPGVYGPEATCFESSSKTAPIPFIDFYSGGIDIVDKDSIDDRGDINMDGTVNSIADAVQFTNYFIIGTSAFGDHVFGSIAASDVNNDGVPLTVADLVYLIRIVVGDAQPYANKPAPGTVFNAALQGDKVVINTTEDAGAALFVFNVNGTVGTPTINNGMDVVSNFENNELRVLVYNVGSEAITNGTELTIPVNGTLELSEVEAATYGGAVMETSVRNLPTSFQVHQNYPNPFNPTTTINFDLNIASNWNVDVYNIAGQKVNSFSGYSEAGPVDVVWDATDANGSTVASGIYFYKVTAGANSATQKMVLLK